METSYEVKESNTGLGLFACTALAKGALVIEYRGNKIPTPVADTLKTKFLFDLENGWTIDGDREDNIARYVNHSCAPNCESSLEDERVFFYALRDIAPDEELTIDYGEEHFNEFIRPNGCRCFVCRS